MKNKLMAVLAVVAITALSGCASVTPTGCCPQMGCCSGKMTCCKDHKGCCCCDGNMAAGQGCAPRH